MLERRLFATLFEGAAADGVVAAVLGYRNDDGGFGHGLEPDKLAPESQPRDVQFALQTLHAAGAHEPEVARRTCDFLGTVADDRGLVPIVLPSVGRYPRAHTGATAASSRLSVRRSQLPVTSTRWRSSTPGLSARRDPASRGSSARRCTTH